MDASGRRSRRVSEPFNPLDKLALAESIERRLLDQPCIELPPPRFDGAGVYAIYYMGDFEAYEPISSPECETPIYVGKAVPSGSRRGGFLAPAPTRTMWSRLGQHARSIELAENLDLDDFRCRYLVVDDIYVPLGEAVLISHFEPVWNSVVEGFGKHDPGAGRRGGRRSSWDELHPGRQWAEQPAARTREEVLARVADFFAGQLPDEELLPGDQED
jgi:hypothetical protein